MSNPTFRLTGDFYTWDEVAKIALDHPAHTDIAVADYSVPPMPAHFTKRPADNDGQKANYGYSLPDNRGIHVKVYDGYYKVHWDKKDPFKDPIGHLFYDAFHWFVVLVIGIIAVVGGAIVAYRFWKKRKSNKTI